ncbi:family A G protein-coupled receptor-like protein [Delitschia confertaspora ATCC 74209]|uniref:Family A G protein-coupled receptor-like protein n=1 Tax=Delitschia confertaspora ATCC 74209 TaxID=1513339 RepID=A0A9P4JTD3_9PLEO|nr:family A G protein-coupled receptor-like protein [Delitschia confertaspora ATCC 74209]
MEAYELAERVMSIFSLLGSFIILTTFLCWHEFRKPINRLIFFATFGNVAANIATLISTSSLRRIHPNAPIALCQFQGVLIQWFLMADSLWTFCMASNVWLTFFRGYNARQLRSLEKYYLLVCYGVPFLPAFIYLMVDAVGHRGIYGDAVIWCWVSKEWDWMRIAFFYAPVWLVLSATATIYIITGHNIFKQRNALRSFTRRPPSEIEIVTDPFTSENLTNIAKVTKIEVVTEKIQPDGTFVSQESANEYDSRSSFASTRNLSAEIQKLNSNTTPSSPQPRDTQTHTISATPQAAQFPRRDAASHANRAAWGYAKVAFLMFVALFIVWVPSTVNRVWSLLYPDNPLFGLNLAAAIVLPTQGFWNAVIYIVTSRYQVKMALRSIRNTVSSLRGQKRNSDIGFDTRYQPRKGSTNTTTSSDKLDLGHEIAMDDINITRSPPGAPLSHGDLSTPSTTSLPDR